MDFKSTLNLPQTDFPMKANLSQSEPERLKRWEEAKVYEQILKSRENAPKYVLHDGPPYANGHIHIGHALNKILKDFIVKIKTSQGFLSPYIPGWDCHGLPIEHQVDKQLGGKKHSMTKAEIRKLCREYAAKFIDIQRVEFKRLGVFGDWDNPYVTMDYVYEMATLKELYAFFKNGGVYKGSKPVYWCASCVTALAEAEVEYDNHTSHSVYVKLALKPEFHAKVGASGKVSMVIWTTTPWTLPANLGVAVHPDFEYSVLKITEADNKNLASGEILIVATEMAEALAKTFSITAWEEVSRVKGADMERFVCTHPFYSRDSLVLLGDHVTLEAGTGLVHTAPGHGQEDYEVGLRYGLEILNPVDDHGKFKPSTELFAGMNINEANPLIIEHIDGNGSLIASGKIEHSYPHCWRCKKPVIYRATPQWFISMEKNDLRKKALEEIRRVEWTPAWGENRITAMIENRPDWCISRQRVWGVPIAVFLCRDCDEVIFNDEIAEKVLAAFRTEGADAWFEHDNDYFLPAGHTCPKCGGANFSKETDILDVWFDSGTSHAAVCETRPELGWPVNMYLEGSDQHRGWFHSTLLASVGARGKAPYSEILTHGFVVDGKGRKMSKSVGNVVNPEEIIKKYGSDILRLWVSAEDYSEDIRISDDIISRLVESYRKIRNTARYLLGSLADFNPETDCVAEADMMEMDRYILSRWNAVKKRIYNAFDKYQFHVFYHTFQNFCITDLSSFYLDIIKDRTYSSKADSIARRSAQTAMYKLVKEMALVMSPILSFTADEVWEYLPAVEGKSSTIFTELFPEAGSVDEALTARWEKVIELRKTVNRALELARAEKVIGHPLDAKVTLAVSDAYKNVLELDEGLRRVLIVSEVTIVDSIEGGYSSEDGAVKVLVEPSAAEKCERCWVHDTTVGQSETHPTICSRCAEALA